MLFKVTLHTDPYDRLQDAVDGLKVDDEQHRAIVNWAMDLLKDDVTLQFDVTNKTVRMVKPRNAWRTTDPRDMWEGAKGKARIVVAHDADAWVAYVDSMHYTIVFNRPETPSHYVEYPAVFTPPDLWEGDKWPEDYEWMIW